jgi:hypothetical protein
MHNLQRTLRDPPCPPRRSPFPYLTMILCSILLAGCPTSAPYFAPTPPPVQPSVADRPKLMLFGGSDHRKYLGCLTCEVTAYDSIFNAAGPYGTCEPFSNNLYCRGPFDDFGGSGPFQNLSACSDSASDPPVIVDKAGSYYGRFSIGGVFAHSEAVCEIFGRFANENACSVVKKVCEK